MWLKSTPDTVDSANPSCDGDERTGCDFFRVPTLCVAVFGALAVGSALSPFSAARVAFASIPLSTKFFSVSLWTQGHQMGSPGQRS